MTAAAERRPGPPAPEAVLFDVGGVFVVPDPGLCREALVADGHAGAADLDDAAFVAAHFAGVAALDAGVSEGRWLRYDAAYGERLGCVEKGPVGVVRHLIATRAADDLWSYPLPGAVEGLRRIAEAGVAVAIVSNSDGTVERKLAELGICQVGPGPGVAVAAVVDSAVAGAAKPDPAVFVPALRAVGVPAERAWYVGDTVTFDVVGARRAGMWPVLHDPLGLDRPGLDGDVTRVPTIGALADLVLSARG
jgi:putative hydrolase of the HAD superfamily